MSDDSPPSAAEATFEEISYFRWEVLLAGFVLLLILIGGGLWIFQTALSMMAGDRVHEARAVLEHPDEWSHLNPGDNPWMEEIHTLRALQLEMDRGLIAEEERRNLENELERRYRDRMLTHELPEDWRDRIPEELENWYRDQRDDYRGAIDDLLDTARDGIRRSHLVLDFLLEIPDEDVPEEFLPYWERSRDKFNHFKSRFSELEEELPESAAEPRLSEETLDRINRFNADLNDLVRHLFRAQALNDEWHGWLYAEQLFHDALRVHPDYPPAYHGLGDAYRKVGLTRVADHYYRQVVRVEPHGEAAEWVREHFDERAGENESDWNRYNRAYVAHHRGETEKAEQILLGLLDAPPEDPLLVYLVQKRLEYLDEGIPSYSKAAYF